MKTLAAALAVSFVTASLVAPGLARAQGLTQEQAVSVALTRNREAIAARLEIEGAELDVVAARVYPNPTLSYAVGNLVLGKGNKEDPMNLHPGFFDQPVQSVGVTQVLDLWSKRGARTRVADEGVVKRRLLTEDALREIAYAVRSAFADLSREQTERDLAREVAARYADTVRLSQSRFRAGDISEAELRKIELEGLRYGNAVVDAEMEWEVSRQKLAALMGLPSSREIPERVTDAAARREAYPDFEVGASYNHSGFQISGDNPNTLGVSLSLPLPIFDRNQAGIGRAALDVRRADNDKERLQLAVEHEVTEAVRRAARAQELLRIYEGDVGAGPVTPVPPPLATSATHDAGGMLKRAEIALSVAEKSYKAGATTLLDLLEAQRTFLDTRAQYLRVLYDFRQAAIDVTHAVGEGRP